MPKTVASLGSEKFKRIGRIETNKILSKIQNTSTRSKLKNEIRHYKFGSGGSSSIKDIAKNIGEVHGSLAVDKFIRAIIKNSQNNLLDEKKKEKNINYSKRQRINEAEAETLTSSTADRTIAMGATYTKKYGSGKKVEPDRACGDIKNIGVNPKVTRGFAEQYKDKRLPDNSVSEASLSGNRPLGF